MIDPLHESFRPAERLGDRYEWIQAAYSDLLAAGLAPNDAAATLARNIQASHDVALLALADVTNGLSEPDQAVGTVMAAADPPFLTAETN